MAFDRWIEYLLSIGGRRLKVDEMVRLNKRRHFSFPFCGNKIERVAVKRLNIITYSSLV